MPDSVAFDRAATYYDRTRGMSPPAMERLIAVLAGELRDADRVLEVGVGTGMISLPLARSGLRMTGIDLSRPMLSRLVEKGGPGGFPAVQADATALPFATGIFDAAVMRHVLHLIPDWRAAVAEALRVVRSGGKLLVSHGSYPEPYRSLFRRFLEEAGVDRPWVGLPPGSEAVLDDLLTGSGARARTLEPVIDEVEEPLEGFVEGMRRGLYSWTWEVDERRRREAAGRVAAWAERHVEPLGASAVRAHQTVFRAYDLP